MSIVFIHRPPKEVVLNTYRTLWQTAKMLDCHLYNKTMLSDRKWDEILKHKGLK